MCYTVQKFSLMSFGIPYSNSVWNPYKQGLIYKDLENVQLRATKLILTVKHLFCFL